ncbi:MAG: hypothetical protein JJE05_03145 [Actinobacteria bacterium]|nr:hypothetical protein [Actinomycetota bacterium]
MSFDFSIPALLQFIAFVVVGYFAGALLSVNRRGAELDGFSWPERLLMIVPGFVCFAVVLMLGNIVTLGLVFGVPGIVPLAAVAVVLFGWRYERGIPGIPWLWVGVAAAVLCLIYLLPVLLHGSGVRTGDPPWHLGWTQQLLHGLPVPLGPAPEIARNSYPWGLHAVLASMTRLVPGSDPLTGYEALHVVTLLSIPLAGACLARRLDLRAGWLGAAATGLIGGFGWLESGSASFIASPSEYRYGADLVVASPNSVYELFPPALPRELGLVLLGAAACACVFAVARADRRLAIAAGVIAGLAGLVSLPIFVSAVVWLTVAALTARKGSRRMLGLAMLGSAVLVMLPWAGKVLVNLVRFGGFLNTSPTLGVEWPLPTALWSWGLLLFLAALGVALAARARPHGSGPMFAFLAGSVTLLTFAIARGAYDWGVWGNATLFHQGRIWPPIHLLGGAFAGFGLTALYFWLRARERLVATAAVVAVLGFGAISPVIAARGIGDILERHDEGFVYGLPDYEPGAFLRRAAAHLGPDDVVQVVTVGPTAGDDIPDARRLAFALFEFSGVRLAQYDDPRLDGNDLRIRYADLAREYDERIAGGGFEADFFVVPRSDVEGEVLEAGTFGGQQWMLVRR